MQINPFDNLKPGDPEPNFLSLSREHNLPVSELQREFAARKAALAGQVPSLLTQAWENEARLQGEQERVRAEIAAGMRLEGEWRSLLARRDSLAALIGRAQGKLIQINSPDTANAALDRLVCDDTSITVLVTEIMRVEAGQAVRKFLGGFIDRKSAELAQLQTDVEAFAALHKIALP